MTLSERRLKRGLEEAVYVAETAARSCRTGPVQQMLRKKAAEWQALLAEIWNEKQA